MTGDSGSGDGFPARVPLKVFLRPDADAERAVLAACEAAAGKTIDHERQPSRNGNFLCLRLTLQADDQAQLDRVREAISAQPSVLLAL